MDDVEATFDQFVYNRNQQDRNNHTSKDARNQKKKIKDSHDVATSSDMVTSVTQSYLALRDLYRQTLPVTQRLEDDPVHLKMERFEKRLLNPKMSVGDAPKQKYQAEGKTTSLTVSLSGTLVANLSLDGSVTKSEIQNDGNPDNDGEYLTFELSLGMSGNGVQVLKSLSENEDFFASIGKGLGFKEKTPFELDPTKDLFSFTHEFDAFEDVSRDGSGAFRMTADFVKSDEGKYKLQYLRFSADAKSEFSLNNFPIPVSPGVDLLLGFSSSNEKTRVIGEILGQDTLTYVQTKFNTWHTPGQESRADWDSFMDNHRQSFDKILENVMNSNSTARQEILKTYDQLNENPGTLLVAIENYNNIHDEDTYEIVKQELYHYLEKQNSLYTAEASSRFHPVETKT